MNYYILLDKAVFVKRNGELVLTEIAADTDLEWVRANTGFELTVADDLKKFEIWIHIYIYYQYIDIILI